MADEKITLRQFAVEKGLSFDAIVRAATDGSININKKHDRASLERVLHTLDPLAQIVSDESAGNLSSETHIVRIRIPGENIYYVTIMRAGKVKLTKDANGNIDTSDPREGIDELINILAYSTMFDTTKRIDLNKKTKKDPKTKKPRTFKPTRDKPGYVLDPQVISYFLENADALAHSALVNPEKIRKGHTLSGRDDLEEIIEDKKFLEKARTIGAVLEAEPIMSYLAQHKREISQKTKKFIGEIIDKEDVRTTAGEVLFEYIDQKDRQRTKLRALCEKADSALPLYKRFYEEKTKRGLEDKGEHFVICFRELALRVFDSAKKAGAEIPNESLEEYISNTSKWVAYSKAADYVKGDSYLQKNIVKKIKDEKDPRHPRDKIFEVVSDLGKMVLDPDHTYDKIFYKFILAGLWMEGIIEKETEEGTKPRTAAGTLNDYTDGLGNLIEKYPTYDRLLKKAFTKELDKGTFSEGYDLSTQAQCSTFGRLLYSSLTEKEQDKFTTMKGEERPLEKEGTYLVRILRSYVGINRDYFKDSMSKK